MRAVTVLAIASAIVAASTSADARGRLRGFSLWSSKPSAPAAAAPVSRSGAFVVLPGGVRSQPDRPREVEHTISPAIATAPELGSRPAVPALRPQPASLSKPQPCAPGNVFGEGVGFCAVN